MPNRKGPNEEKILPLLSFKVPMEITFSIGTTDNIRNQITKDIANLNKDFSDVCREILFKDLNIKTKLDADYYFSEATKIAKEKIYKDLQISRQKSFGSDYIIVQIQKYIQIKQKTINRKK